MEQLIERAVFEKFRIDGGQEARDLSTKLYQVRRAINGSCAGCLFNTKAYKGQCKKYGNQIGQCKSQYRSDHRSVIVVEVG